MAWEENSRICINMQLIAILSRIGVPIRGQQHVTYGVRLHVTYGVNLHVTHWGYDYMSLFERQGVRLPILLEIS